MTKIAKAKTDIQNIHEKSSCMSSCMSEVFNAVKALRARTYKTYTNFTKKHYLILGDVLCYTYNYHAHSNINS